MMKTALKSLFLGGVLMLLVSACATTPTEPLVLGEVRLTKVRFLEFGAIKKNLKYEVNLSFEATGEADIKRACFYWSGNGPYCFNILEVRYGSPGTIVTFIATPDPGMYSLEGYVLYMKDRKMMQSNLISTPVEITK